MGAAERATVRDVKGSDLEELSRRLEGAPRNAAGRRQFDEDVRGDVVDYVRARVSEGASKTQATRELGLEQRTVWGWMQRRVRPVVRAVEVTDTPAAKTPATRTFELRFPGGAAIGGLTLEDISTLMRGEA